jgi:hypothetical protein
LTLSEADTANIVARFDQALVKAKLRYDFDFDMPLLEDASRVARGLLSDTQPACHRLGSLADTARINQ